MFATVLSLILTPVLAAAAEAATSTSSPDASFTGNVVLVLVLVGGQVLSLGMSAVGLILAARRTPPIAEELYKLFLTKEEAAGITARIDHTIESAFNEINAVRSQATKAFGDLERAIGRLEGHLTSRTRPPHG